MLSYGIPSHIDTETEENGTEDVECLPPKLTRRSSHKLATIVSKLVSCAQNSSNAK